MDDYVTKEKGKQVTLNLPTKKMDRKSKCLITPQVPNSLSERRSGRAAIFKILMVDGVLRAPILYDFLFKI